MPPSEGIIRDTIFSKNCCHAKTRVWFSGLALAGNNGPSKVQKYVPALEFIRLSPQTCIGEN